MNLSLSARPISFIATEPRITRRRPTGNGTLVEVLRDPAELRALLRDWEALAAEAAEPNPFYEPWMLLPALEAYGAGDNFRCVAVWDDGVLGALFPMRIEPRFHGLPLPVLRSYRHRNMQLWCPPLVRAKNASSCIAALLGSDLAPLVQFDWTAAGGAFYGALTEAATAGGFPWLVTDSYVRAILVRDRDPRPQFNSNLKNNLRRCEARLAKHGEVTAVRMDAGSDLAAWTAEFLELEASGWKGREGTALACRADDRQFIAAVLPEAFRRGQLHISGLNLNGRALARHMVLSAGEGGFTFKIAFDESYEKCSPGLLGEVENVRQFLAAPGPRWIDSNTARENTSYGRVWKDRRTVQRVAVGTRGLGRVAAAALPLVKLAKRGVGRIAQSLRAGVVRR